MGVNVLVDDQKQRRQYQFTANLGNLGHFPNARSFQVFGLFERREIFHHATFPRRSRTNPLPELTRTWKLGLIGSFYHNNE
jgi:hypothetical protein